MDKGAWWATVQGGAKRQTRLSTNALSVAQRKGHVDTVSKRGSPETSAGGA